MEVKKYLIETEEISAEIIPALGGRIESLIYKPSGKNWVWKNDKINGKGSWQKNVVKVLDNHTDGWYDEIRVMIK